MSHQNRSRRAVLAHRKSHTQSEPESIEWNEIVTLTAKVTATRHTRSPHASSSLFSESRIGMSSIECIAKS